MVETPDFIRDAVFLLIKKAVTELPDDVVAALEKAFEEETNEVARLQLKTMLRNVELAKTLQRPICQDTGTLIFFVEVGYDFPFKKDVNPSIVKAVKRATKEIPLRSNTVNPFTGKNSGTNIGRHIPWVEWCFVEGDMCKITVLPKGGGSENGSALKMFNPTVSMEEVKRFIVNHVVNMGGRVCPPTVVGIGFGGGADIALKLAKKAVLRSVGERNKNKTVAEFEVELVERLNKTGVGPMGLGGKTTVLDVHVDFAERHPASFPVGIVMQCWVDRRASMILARDGEVIW